MKIRDVKQNEPFSVVLKDNPSTGFRWKYVKIPNINQIKENHTDLNPGVIGGSTEVEFHFVATEPGEYELKICKNRPWEKNAPPIETYAEVIRVQ